MDTIRQNQYTDQFFFTLTKGCNKKWIVLSEFKWDMWLHINMQKIELFSCLVVRLE